MQAPETEVVDIPVTDTGAQRHKPFTVPWTLPQRPDPNIATNRHLDGDELTTFQKQLTKHITRTCTWTELRDLVAEYGPYLNTIHITATLTHLAKFPAPVSSTQYDAFCQNVVDWVGLYSIRFDQRGLVNCVWAMAKLSRRPASCSIDDILEHLQPKLQYLKAQELANLLWAMATLPHKPQQRWLQDYLSALPAALPHMKPQELSNTLWALAKLQHHIPQQQAAPSQQATLQGEDPALDSGSKAGSAGSSSDHEQQDLRHAILQRVQQLMPSFSTAELVNAFWALGSLGTPTPAALQEDFLNTVLAELEPEPGHGLKQEQQQQQELEDSQQHGRQQASRAAGRRLLSGTAINSHDTAMVMWSICKHSMRPTQQQWHSLLQHTQQHLPSCSPHTLAVLLHSAAACGKPPSKPWLTAALQQCYSQPLPATRSALVNVLWALVKMGAPVNTRWLSSYLEAVQQVAGSCSPAELSSISWSLAQLSARGLLPAAHAAGAAQQQQQEQQPAAADAQPGLASDPPTSSQQQEAGSEEGTKPGPRSSAAPLLALIEQRSLLSMQQHSARDVSTLLWSFARLGHQPAAAWQASCLEQLSSQLQAHSINLACLSTAAAALAALRMSPSSSLLRSMESSAAQQLQAGSSRDVACIAAAFAQLRHPLGRQTCTQLLLRAGQLLPGMSCRDVAQLLWALAKMGCRPDDDWLQEAVAALVPALRSDVCTSSSASSSSGGASSGASKQQPLQQEQEQQAGWQDVHSRQAAAGAQQACGSINGQDLANMLWALSRFNYHPGHSVLMACSARTLSLSATTKPQALTTSLWSLAHLHLLPSRSSMRGMVAAAAVALPSASAAEGINMLWALSELAHCDIMDTCPIDQPVLEGFVVQLQPQLPSCSAAELLVLLLVLARHSYMGSSELLQQVKEEADKRAGQLPPAKQALLQEALARLGDLQA